MKLIKMMKGYRPIAFVNDGILLAKGYKLYLGDLTCQKLKFIGSVPHTLSNKIAIFSRLLERTLRLGIRFGCAISGNRYLLASNRRIWLLDMTTYSIKLDHVVGRGSRPLSTTASSSGGSLSNSVDTEDWPSLATSLK